MTCSFLASLCVTKHDMQVVLGLWMFFVQFRHECFSTLGTASLEFADRIKGVLNTGKLNMGSWIELVLLMCQLPFFLIDLRRGLDPFGDSLRCLDYGGGMVSGSPLSFAGLQGPPRPGQRGGGHPPDNAFLSCLISLNLEKDQAPGGGRLS